MSNIYTSSKEYHPYLSYFLTLENLSKFSFASQYFYEKYGLKGQDIGKYEYGLGDTIVLEPCKPLEKYGLGYQRKALVISSTHVVSCEREPSTLDTLSITTSPQPPCDQFEEDALLESLFINTLSHEILPYINVGPLLSPFLMIDNPIFFDHGLYGFVIYLNPSFNMSMPLDYDITSSPTPFMFNFDYGELI